MTTNWIDVIQIKMLPTSLESATIRMMRPDSIAREPEVFGNDFVDHYGGTREHEVKLWNEAVTNWEGAFPGPHIQLCVYSKRPQLSVISSLLELQSVCCRTPPNVRERRSSNLPEVHNPQYNQSRSLEEIRNLYIQSTERYSRSFLRLFLEPLNELRHIL